MQIAAPLNDSCCTEQNFIGLFIPPVKEYQTLFIPCAFDIIIILDIPNCVHNVIFHCDCGRKQSSDVSNDYKEALSRLFTCLCQTHYLLGIVKLPLLRLAFYS